MDKKPSIARKVHKRLFIECTYTYLYGGNTGIQRVVRNIVNNCRGVGRKMGVRGQPVVWTADSFITVRDVDVKGRHFYTARMWLKDLARSLARFMPPMYIFRFLRSSRLVVELRAVAGKILKIVGKPVLRYVSRMRHKKVDFEEGDILLLLDSSWHTPFWEGVRQARERGVRVGVVIYDLIPLRFAHTCDQCLVRIFQEWLLKAFSCTDFFLAISNAVRDDLKAYMREVLPISDVRQTGVGSFRLGADLDGAKKSSQKRKHILDILKRQEMRKPYLMVSTIEPRKNHDYLLDAFDRVWSKDIRVPLVIVGKVGWMCEPIVKRIETHCQWQKQLFMFNDLNDAELSYCYKVSKALVFPSQYEGFGLPIVEALNENLIVLASDIPVHREVGGEYCRYFDLSSPESLANLILDYEKNGYLPPARPPDSFTWLDWKESCLELIRKAFELAESSRETVGQVTA